MTAPTTAQLHSLPSQFDSGESFFGALRNWLSAIRVANGGEINYF